MLERQECAAMVTGAAPAAFAPVDHPADSAPRGASGASKLTLAAKRSSCQ
jgi:hypothetical protein